MKDRMGQLSALLVAQNNFKYWRRFTYNKRKVTKCINQRQ